MEVDCFSLVHGKLNIYTLVLPTNMGICDLASELILITSLKMLEY